MELGLENSVVLVVGGSGYIGAEVARQFVAEGARVVIAGRTPERLAAAAEELGGGVSTVELDTSSTDSVTAGIAEVVDRFGRLDVVVNTAAPSARTLDPSRNGDPEQVIQAFDGKAMGYLRVSNAALSVMKPANSGRIVFVNGQNAYVTGSITGSVRNGAVLTISKNLADANAGSGITVNTVNPGTVSDDPSFAPRVGVPGETTPAQIASVVVFLSSPLAAGVSGESISVGHRVQGAIGG